MDYVPITGYDEGINMADQPRFLTREEIVFITSHMPLAPSSDAEAAHFNRNNIIRWMTAQLREIKLAPSAIPEYIEHITKQHYKSLIAPGTPVGIWAAEALGATSTQMTLNSVAPFELIEIYKGDGTRETVQIGEWIDKLLLESPKDIQHIPENRTQYLPLKTKVFIVSPSANGTLAKEPITAITKHLPVGDLVKITTRSGRSVTATQSKSLLIWNGSEFAQTAGNAAKVGDFVPVDITHDAFELVSDNVMMINNVEYKVYNQVILDPIINIEYVSGIEYVYDLTVPATTNFCLANGLGVADTFHTSGSAKSVSAGNDAMTDIIFARRNPKNESCTIYFTNMQMTYEEVLNTRSYIVGSMVSDFIVDYDIDDIKVMQRYWWHSTVPQLLGKHIAPTITKVLRLFLNVPEMYKHRVTITQIAEVLEKDVPSSVIAIHGSLADGIIDLYPQPMIILETLKSHGIDGVPAHLLEITFLQTIVMPELKNIRVKGISGIRNLYPITSPVWRVVIVERKVEERDLTEPIVDAVLRPYLGQAYMLVLNQSMMNLTGISSRNVAALCKLAGLTIVESPAIRPGQENHDRLYVVMPDDRYRVGSDEVLRTNNGYYKRLDPAIVRLGDVVNYRIVDAENIHQDEQGWIETIADKVTERVPINDVVQENATILRRIRDFIKVDSTIYERITNPAIKVKELKPGEYVAVKIELAKEQRKKQIRVKTDKITEVAQRLPEAERRAMLRRPIDIPKTPLMRAAEFVYAETDGANLKELLALPGIDKRRTTCNNMYVIAETFGIEAARSFIIRALHNVIGNAGSYVHPANITFIAEFITSRGKPYGATYTGISRQPGGHLSLATLERAGKVFIQNAIHGRKEDIRGVSASVAVGARMAIGTGYSDVGQNITEDNVERVVINDDIFTAHERDDEEKVIMQQTAVPVGNIVAGDVTEAVNFLKNVVDGGFDTNPDEEGTNLLTIFAGEIIPDLNQRQARADVGAQRIVRRVQEGVVPEVPADLVDMLVNIKTAIPADDQGLISPLEALPAEPDVAVQPIVSTGLVTFDEAPPPAVGTYAFHLAEMFDKMFPVTREPEVIEPEPIIQTVVQGLPEVNIPELPALDDFELQHDLYEARREQVRDLEPINTAAFMTATQQ
jgi:hypothetical protein